LRKKGARPARRPRRPSPRCAWRILEGAAYSVEMPGRIGTPPTAPRRVTRRRRSMPPLPSAGRERRRSGRALSSVLGLLPNDRPIPYDVPERERERGHPVMDLDDVAEHRADAEPPVAAERDGERPGGDRGEA